MQLFYTPIYAAILGLLILVLAAKVVVVRRKKRIGIGTNGDQELSQQIRVHANAIEYVPMALILLAFVEMSGANIYWVNACGITLVISRIMHAYGLGKSIGISFGRFYGTALTWLLIILNSGYILIHAISQLL